MRRSPKSAVHAGVEMPGVSVVRSAPRDSGPAFLLAVESPRISNELRRLLDSLLENPACEILPPDGPTVLGRLRSVRPKLAFLSMRMKRMEGLTVMRALPVGRARSVVFLAADTMDGYRAAWEALHLGSRDILVTRGSPPQRFKGNAGQRLRRLALLLGSERMEAEWPDPRVLRRFRPGADPAASPLVLLAEPRYLAAAGRWLQTLEPDYPVVLRVPDGPRFLRVVREGLSRNLAWPVRILLHGDRLVSGHVHLFSDTETLRVATGPGHPSVELQPAVCVPGSWPAHLEALEHLRRSSLPLQILACDLDDPEIEARLIAAGHAVHCLEAAPGEAVGTGREAA